MHIPRMPLLASKLEGIVARQRSYRPFIVLTHARSGSSFLLDVLLRHPDVVGLGEVFRTNRGRYGRALILKTLFGNHGRHVRAAGFKIFYYHPNDTADDALWDALCRQDGLHVIHLYRQDVIGMVLSRELAARTDAYHQHRSEKAAEVEPFEVDVEAIVSKLERTAGLRRERLQQLGQHPIMDLGYEDLVSDPETQFGRVFEFLGLPPRPVQSNFKRNASVDWSRVVLNYDELQEVIGRLES